MCIGLGKYLVWCSGTLDAELDEAYPELNGQFVHKLGKDFQTVGLEFWDRKPAESSTDRLLLAVKDLSKQVENAGNISAQTLGFIARAERWMSQHPAAQTLGFIANVERWMSEHPATPGKGNRGGK